MATGTSKDIKRRMKSIESTKQITKAMEMVASSKLRRAKDQVEQARPFFTTLYETIHDITDKNDIPGSVYAKKRTVRASGFIVIAGDRGLAGGYNVNVFKHAAALMEGKHVKVLPIGKKAMDYFSKHQYELLDVTLDSPEDVNVSSCLEISEMIAQAYLDREIDELYIVYTNFVSALTQEASHIQLLPLVFRKSAQKTAQGPEPVTLYEPSAQAVFDRIVPQYIAGVLYGAITESYASEQAARRTAMESATDNAEDILEELNLSFNRARQAAITQEISEIVAGADALK